MSILVNRVDNVRRPPDWRWQRAGEIIENGGRIVRRRDDMTIRAVCKFRRLLNRCQSDEDRLIALDACPEMYEAYMLYDASEDPTEHRWELEARLLARESREAIAAKMGICDGTIANYEQAFFDVCNRLSFPSLILHTVIGRSVQSGLAERDYDVLWKLLGYFAGPHVLDAYIYKFASPAHADGVEGVRAFWKDFTRDQVSMKSGVAIMTMPINWQTRELILGLWQKMLEVEAHTGQLGGGSEAVVQNIGALTNSLKDIWHKYLPGVDAPLSGKVAEIEAGGVRLRATELAMLGVGQQPTGLEHLITTACFPTKRGNDEDNAEA